MSLQGARVLCSRAASQDGLPSDIEGPQEKQALRWHAGDKHGAHLPVLLQIQLDMVYIFSHRNVAKDVSYNIADTDFQDWA